MKMKQKYFLNNTRNYFESLDIYLPPLSPKQAPFPSELNILIFGSPNSLPLALPVIFRHTACSWKGMFGADVKVDPHPDINTSLPSKSP